MSTADAGTAPAARLLCRRCGLALAVLCLLAWASFAVLQLDLRPIAGAAGRAELGAYLSRFFPPDLSAGFLRRTAAGALETIAISLIGTLLAAIAGAILALPASGRSGAAGRAAARLLLNLLRSVPELVWAALMVLAAGLGPFAGTLALALHTSGVLGRLFADALENAPAGPEQALREAGTPALPAFLLGMLPVVAPQFLSYTLYRWEMNLRMATVLGFVGAGGLGQMLYYEFSLLHEPRASTLIVAMLALSILIDAASARLRALLQRR